MNGTFYMKMWLPDPVLVHGPDFGAGSPPGGEPPQAPSAPDVVLKDHGTPGEHAFEGEIFLHLEGQPDGTLKGDANGTPINYGYYTGDSFFRVDFPAGPGRWEIWAHVEPSGDVEGMVSLGGGGGFPNLAYGKRLEETEESV